MLRQTLRRLRDKVFGRNTRTTIIVINAPVAPPPTRTPSHVIRSNAQRSAPPADLSLKLHELDEAQRGRRDQSALPTVVTHRETYVVDRNKPETIFELPPYTEADNSNGGEHSEANNAGKESTNKPPAYEDKAHHNINHIRFGKSEVDSMLADAVAYLASLRD